jgi:hypothetical protein
MTDETRAELRKGFEIMVRAAMGGEGAFLNERTFDSHGTVFVTELTSYQRSLGVTHPGQLPPLTAAQHLALSVLVGEPDAVIADALADYMLNQGHEYATACYAKGRREEWERVLAGGWQDIPIGAMGLESDWPSIRTAGQWINGTVVAGGVDANVTAVSASVAWEEVFGTEVPANWSPNFAPLFGTTVEPLLGTDPE